MERRIIRHAGRPDNPAAHAQADQGGLDRGAELSAVTVPTLVVDAPEDPVNPPPHAAHLAALVGGADLVTIPGMGHAFGRAVIEPLATTILAHAAPRGCGGRGGRGRVSGCPWPGRSRPPGTGRRAPGEVVILRVARAAASTIVTDLLRRSRARSGGR